MQASIQKLLELGPLPSESTTDIALLQQWQDTLATVTIPLDVSEAEALCRLFGPDGCFGLAWAVVKLIETSSDLSDEYLAALPPTEWRDLLTVRRANARKA